jgi:anti-sigma factor RsiW
MNPPSDSAADPHAGPDPDRDRALTDLLRRHATRHVASDGLRAAIRTQVALASAGRAADADASVPGSARWRWREALVGFAVGVAALLAAQALLPMLGIGTSTDAELVAHHVRALGEGPLVEVASSDRHTVKPWFQGRIDFAPPVPDLAVDGFPLQGGRVDVVHGQRVAVLTYLSARHVIEVFVSPGAGPEQPRSGQRNGFNVVGWRTGDLQVKAVSDVEAAMLLRFVDRWRAAAP